MMEFIIQENLDNPSEQEKYFAELIDGEAKIYRISLEDSSRDLIAVQPWYPRGDGTRVAWTDLNQVVNWYQQITTGEQNA